MTAGRWLILLLLFCPVAAGAAAQETPAQVPVASTHATPAAALDAETKCLALAVYWEGKTEAREGRLAVAHTVLNRMKSPEFPDTICGVVAQKPDGGRKGCQFSWWCDGKQDEPKDDGDWDQAVAAARAAMTDAADPTRGALYFHSVKIRPPAWASKRKRIGRIGDHVFYR
jgi:spore germination cell wall hydrolase CwlJ-like protein